ncbi:haloacid dehalogenase [Haloquadratum walsbyi]|uniref:Putative hydrolase of the HAD superfamily n=1 Tax=Haloquadratum walsbyi J07HQW2 TaxID=1238425 RepID=U1NCC7_9EURY|nr:haloacid dehalogenase [Haloquadratum walsbyi]ERG94575.1 MAG: putative hydrolase of the HAD superfamily [Haloquadratum walsbyi J07HQW2]
MDRYDRLYALYENFSTDTLRDRQNFIDLFPPVDSRVALEYWEDAHNELQAQKNEIHDAFASGRYAESDTEDFHQYDASVDQESNDDTSIQTTENVAVEAKTMATVASQATREQAFTALDLCMKYQRKVNALVLDVDETLRSAGGTDNEIPRETLHHLTEIHEAGLPIIICTGQTLENVKGFAIQGLGSELVHSGDLSIVYEAGTGVFTPGHGSDTKRLLYAELDSEIRSIFTQIRSQVLPEAPETIQRSAHLQGNEFNITLKPNYETGSDAAETVIDDGLCYLIDLLGNIVAEAIDMDDETVNSIQNDTAATVDLSAILDDASGNENNPKTQSETTHGIGALWARAYYASADPEIATVLAETDAASIIEIDSIPTPVRVRFDRIDVAYYHADAAEIGSLDLDKPTGVQAALDVLDISDPFTLIMGDSKSDLRIMEWAQTHKTGIAAAPRHASARVVEHVRTTDDLIYEPGDAASILRVISVLNQLDPAEYDPS